MIVGWNGCSTHGNQVFTNPEVKKESPALDQGSFEKRAETYFQQGKEQIAQHNYKEAKESFDKTIEVLMESDLKTPVQKSLLKQYITKISEIEFELLKEREMVKPDPESDQSFLEEIMQTPLLEPTETEIRQVQEQLKSKNPGASFSIPITVNSNVVSFVRAFQTIRFKNIQNALNRSANYIDDFKRIFRENKVPEDLAYLPLIESGYRVEAISRASACGVWQFMAGTARLYGLKVTDDIDERRDPYKSTAAAARYLKRLFEDYGDWYLCLASYNGGPRRVNNAVKRLNSNDFFTIAKRRYFRTETINYVPAFLASLIIAKNPEAFGFKIEASEHIFGKTKYLEVPSPVSLKDIAEIAQLPADELKSLNPELVNDYTPFDSNTYSLRMPETVDNSLDFSQIKRIPESQRIKHSRGKTYKVKRGDSLYTIARKFNTTVQRIKAVNNLRSNKLKPGKRLIIPSGRR